MAIPVVNELLIVFNQYPIISTATILVAVAFGAILVYKDRYVEDEFDEVTIEERVKGNLQELARAFGKEPRKALTHGFDTLGKAEKALITNTALKEFDPGDREDVEEVSDEAEEESMCVFKVRPLFKHDPGKWFGWFFLEDLTGIKEIHDIAVLKYDSVQIDSEIFIEPDVNFTKTAGVFVEKTDDGQAFVQETAFQDILTDSLTTFSNVVELMNLLNINYSMDMSKLEKEVEVLKELDDSEQGTLGRLNNG